MLICSHNTSGHITHWELCSAGFILQLGYFGMESTGSKAFCSFMSTEDLPQSATEFISAGSGILLDSTN